jgi:hypothetical protein
MTTEEQKFQTFPNSITIPKSELYTAFMEYLAFLRDAKIQEIESKITELMSRQPSIDPRSFLDKLLRYPVPEKTRLFATRKEALQYLREHDVIEFISDGVNKTTGKDYGISVFPKNAFIHLVAYAKYSEGETITLSIEDFKYIASYLPKYNEIKIPSLVE